VGGFYFQHYISSLHLYIRQKESTDWFMKNFITSKELFLIMFFATCRHFFSARVDTKQTDYEADLAIYCMLMTDSKDSYNEKHGGGSTRIIFFLEKLKIPFIRSELFSIVHLCRKAYFKENLELPDNSLAGHLLQVKKVDHHTPLVYILIIYDNRK